MSTSIFNHYTLAGNQGSSLVMMLPIILIVVMFIFMSRSQKKQERETNEMRNSVVVGDEITTIGGIIGRVVNIREDNIVIETSSDRTKIKISRRAIYSVEKKVDAEPANKPATFKVKK